MAYSTPPRWTHGDTVADTDMQIYSDDLDALHAVLGDAAVYFPAAHAVPGIDNDQHYFVHRYRWLWFQSDGAIVDPGNPTVNTQTLTEDTEPTLLDLNTIEWLFPGKLYSVEGCTWAQEVEYA